MFSFCHDCWFAGSSAYPVTLFTDAPPAVLAETLAAVVDSSIGPLGASSSAPQPPLLRLQQLSVATPAGCLAVADLSLELHPGQHLLIAGELGGWP